MKIFFSDLDGTLLTSDKTISPLTKKALDSFVSGGNLFVISTGRPLESALILRDRLGLNYPGSYISAFNGTQLYDNSNEKILDTQGIPLDMVPDLLDLADEFSLHIHAYQGRYVISRHANAELEYYLGHIMMPGIVSRNMLDELTEPPCKMLAISLDDHERLREFSRELERRFGTAFSFAFSSENFVDIYPFGCGKGSGLERLCGLLDIPVSDSIAAGDEQNDIPAIRTAGLGIAMKNASDIVKEAADIVTGDDNDHDGLVPFLLA